MSFDSQKIIYGRNHIAIVEIDLDICKEVYGVSPCIAGLYTMTITVTSGDFDVGDLIKGVTSGAQATLETVDKSGAPSYDLTFRYIIDSTGTFTIGAESIENIKADTVAGEATKNASDPIQQPANGFECYNTFQTCQDRTNYNPFVSTGNQTINVNATNGTFTRSAGSYLTDGFGVGDKVFTSGNDDRGNNSTFIISILTATVLTVVDKVGLVTASGNGDEVIKKTLFKTYSFCENQSPQPVGLIPPDGDPDYIPCAKSFSISPAKIDLKGGLGVRSNANIGFNDLPHSDINIDPYPDNRVNDPLTTGSFWTKLRARHPDYLSRPMRVRSGYLVDGVYDSGNFETRNYIIANLTASNGKATLLGKDPLKLASNKKAQAPFPSTAILLNDLNEGVQSSFTVDPIGAGDANFGLLGECLIDKEVIQYTRIASSDTLNIVSRGERNTSDADHKEDATVQECLVYTSLRVDGIVTDLLVNYANIDPTFINSNVWATEAQEYLTGLLSAIIVKPMDVNKLLMELSENKPHYLWWDERSQQIRLTAVVLPPENANIFNMDANLVAGTVVVKDIPKMRVSTVFVNFGQFDPTLKLDEVGNFSQSYARVDLSSITKYGSSEIKTINSRWLDNGNKVGAIQAASTIGRRFANIPRQIDFQLDPKDSSGAQGLWVGVNMSINYRDICDRFGVPINTIFQVLSAKESGNYNFTAMEYNSGGALTDDEQSVAEGFKVVRISEDQFNYNMREEFNGDYILEDDDKVKFILEKGSVVGSAGALAGFNAMVTGEWVDKLNVTLLLVIEPDAYIAGVGGIGDGIIFPQLFIDGGIGLELQNDITLNNGGRIGGGGGGGGRSTQGTMGRQSGGGGGAGAVVGPGGQAHFNGQDGTLLIGGAAGTGGGTSAGRGGDLGEDGQNGSLDNGGIGGDAIRQNGFTITEELSAFGVIDVNIGLPPNQGFSKNAFSDGFG